MMRIGHGFDVHKFGVGNFITLGGEKIPYSQGLVAHSDGDVLIHALCDALLGACALGDIGHYFPDTDSQYKNINSRQLLTHVITLVREKGWQLSNMDATIIAQAPKMAPYIENMRHFLAEDLQVDIEQLNIKATTTEKLGFIGREEGIAVHVVVLLIAYA